MDLQLNLLSHSHIPSTGRFVALCKDSHHASCCSATVSALRCVFARFQSSKNAQSPRLFHSMMLVSFQAFWLSSNCSSPSLLIISCAAGNRTPSLLLLSLSLMLISPAVRLKLDVCVSQ